MNTETAIIGAGPAGIAAALQLKRYGIDALLFEEGQPGGLLRNANLVENYPGFSKGITGPQLVLRLQEHLKTAGIEVIHKTVETLDYNEQEKRFSLSASGVVYRPRIVVGASGTTPRVMDLEQSLPHELKKNIYYEVSPLAAVRGKKILIIGAGDAAYDYALNLSSGNEVIIANRGEWVKALPLLIQRVAVNPRIRYLKNTTVTKIVPGVEKALLVSLFTSDDPERLQVVEIDNLVCALGREPRTDFYAPRFSKLKEDLKHRGVFFEIGDVVNGIFRQVAVAVGDGTLAAMIISREEREGKNRRN